MDVVPEEGDLKEALSILNDKKWELQWKKFGLRLIDGKVTRNKDLSMTTQFGHLINFVYQQEIPGWPTWGNVIKALEYPIEGKYKSEVKVNDIIVAQKVREFMIQELIYVKYMNIKYSIMI